MRNTLIDALKGIAIPLVVCAHYVPASAPAYWSWYAGTFIPGFVMDIFFLISGYLFGARPIPTTLGGGAAFIGKKARRLMVPFFSIALLFFLLKIPTQAIVRMHTPVTFETLFLVLVNPERSYVPVIWFLETLFLLFAVFVALHLIVRNKYFLACLLLAAPLLLPVPDAPILELVCKHLPAFCLGVLFSGVALPETGSRLRAFLAALALCGVMIAVFQLGPAFMGPYIKLARALAVCLFTIACLEFLPGKVAELLSIPGLYASAIYLLHFPFASLVKKIVDQVFHAPESAFWLFAVPAFAVSIAMPILLEQLILQKRPKLLMSLLGETPSDKRTRLRKALGLRPATTESVGVA